MSEKIKLACSYARCPRKGKPFPVRNKRGPQPKYCSDACRKKASHDRLYMRIEAVEAASGL